MVLLRKRMISQSDYFSFINQLDERDCSSLVVAIDSCEALDAGKKYDANPYLSLTKLRDGVFNVRDSRTGYSLTYSSGLQLDQFKAFLISKDRKSNNGRRLEDVLNDQYNRKD